MEAPTVPSLACNLSPFRFLRYDYSQLFVTPNRPKPSPARIQRSAFVGAMQKFFIIYPTAHGNCLPQRAFKFGCPAVLAAATNLSVASLARASPLNAILQAPPGKCSTIDVGSHPGFCVCLKVMAHTKHCRQAELSKHTGPFDLTDLDRDNIRKRLLRLGACKRRQICLTSYVAPMLIFVGTHAIGSVKYQSPGISFLADRSDW